jgi:glycosyltransferase involved in cell wall biosynthesis
VKISIAMASYNGEAFLPGQLESFATQTRPPDELVISDDGSTDRTAEIVTAFAARAPFAVHFHPGTQRLGYTRNFERAIALSGGDVIFLSDQDDIWFDDKIRTISERFETSPATLVVVNDQIMTGADLADRGPTKLANLKAIGRSSDGLIEGCCTAIRSQWARLALPIPEWPEVVDPRHLSYDRWLNELAILLEVRAVEERPLQLFRRHGANTTEWMVSEPRQVGIGDLVATRVDRVPVEAWQARIHVLDAYERWIRENRDGIAACGGDAEAAFRSIAHERSSHAARIALTGEPLPRRLLRIAGLLRHGGYRYFFGWKSAVRDIVRSRG